MKNTIINIFLITVLLFAVIALSTKQKHDWDMIAYMGVVHSYEIESAESIHSKVYQTLQKEVSDEEIYRLTNDANSYRQEMAKNPVAFQENLSFYSNRLLYNSLIYIVYKMGFSLPYAIVLISILAYFFIGLLFLDVLHKNIKDQTVKTLLFFCILFLYPLTQIARMETPDCLSTLWLLLFVCLSVNKRSWLALLAMVLAIFTRPDNIIFGLLFYILRLFTNRNRKDLINIVIAIFTLAISSVLIIISTNAIGLKTVFYHTFVEKINYPISQQINVNVNQYIKVFIKEIDSFLPFAFLGILLNYFSLKISNWNFRGLSTSQIILLTTLMVLGIRFLLFPAVWTRMYLGYGLIVLILGIVNLPKMKANFYNEKVY